MLLAAFASVVIDYCHDGDTCTTMNGEKVRLACIDTPEINDREAHPLPAIEARDYLRDLVVGKEVLLRRIAKDHFGRTVAEMYLEKKNIQEELVSVGHARIVKRFAHQCPWTKQ